MGISNQIPNSRLAQPGVCTSTTRPASPYEGQVIYETDTNRVLVYDASAWVMIADTDTPPGLQLVRSETGVTATNASPKGVESVFTSDFRNYRLEFDFAQTTANGELQIQFYTGTNTLFNSALYNYSYGGSFVSAGPSYNFAAFAVTNPFSPITAMTIGFCANTYNAAGWIDIITPNIATSTRFLGQNYTAYTGTYYNASMHGSGAVESATQFTGFRFIPTAGTSTINYRLYGYRD